MARRSRIVFLDDEADLAEALAEYLADLGHDTAIVADGLALETELQARPCDLVVLDLNLPGGRSGFDLLQDIEALRDCGVIFLSGRAEPLDRVIGLELGADDFLAKPVDPRELAARVAAVLERRAGRARRLVPFETATADLGAARVLLPDGATEPLSPSEVALLRAFADHPHRVLTREDLLALAPGQEADPFDRAVDARVARLRRKLGTARLVTVRGQGYRYEPPWET